ncbi:MAG TPA: hypothetical protein VGT03_14590 [Candidatus Acidoferrales bacterium]|nr:hypothetical protein [Candidatus Acidoferrales bacterium]
MSILAVILAFGLAVLSQTGSPSAATASQVPANSSQTAPSKPYHVVRTMPLPFLKRLGGRFAFEAKSRRLFIADGKDLIVINADTGETVGTITKVGYASDIAFAPDIHKGFVVDSEHSGLVVFDLQTLTIIEKVRKVPESSLVLYDAATNKVVTASAQSKDCQVFEPLTDKVIATLKLGGFPLQGVNDSVGHVYFELGREAFRDPREFGLDGFISNALPLGTSAEIAVLDGQSLQITDRWKEPSCKNMRLIGIDRALGRLFAGCGSSLAEIDVQTGKLDLSTPIPVKLLWYLKFDEELGDVFAVVPRPPTLIVLHENPSGGFDRPVIGAAKWFSDLMVFDDKAGSFFVLQSDDENADTGLFAAIPGVGMQSLKVPEPVPGTFRLVVYSKN